MKLNAIVLTSVLALATSATALAAGGGIETVNDAATDAGLDGGIADAALDSATTTDGGGDTLDSGDTDAASVGDDDDDDGGASDAAAVTVGCVGKTAGARCYVSAGGNLAYCLGSADDGGALSCGYATGAILPDSGAPVTAADAGNTSGGSTDDDSGCNLGGGSSSTLSVFALLGLVLPFVTRRRRKSV